MKQVLQDLSKGNSLMVEAPVPQLAQNKLLVDTNLTLISVGTERMLVDFGKASYFQKAKQQPEKVKEVLEKVKTDGLISTVDAVRSKLAEPLALGYCNVGMVSAVSHLISGFKPGDRVVSNAPHADVVSVAQNLCARIPESVDDESAVFTVVASIALQGIRLVKPTLGESVAVIGVGLIGLLTVQLLKAQGCRVLAIDFDDKKLELARQFGAETCNPKLEDSIVTGNVFGRGAGVDAVIITASTKSNAPVTQAARMSRKRGRIVLVGVTGLELNRADFYEKELSFQVSCSYGPGRYDPSYEEEGQDYPIGFVRWTEQRNFEAVLDMMAEGRINVKPLITHRFAFEEASKAYDILTNDKSVLGILLKYESEIQSRQVKEVPLSEEQKFQQDKPIIGFVGAGNYASRVLIPAFKKVDAQLQAITTSGGVSAAFHGKKMGFSKAVADASSLLSDDAINLIAIASRHDSHAQLVTESLNAKKHVFVEKPLALTMEELSAIEAAYYTANLGDKRICLMVGFNRRFAPLTQKMKALLHQVHSPKAIIITVNAGAIPSDHWAQDLKIGGGRIIGEACHFIDLMRFLVGAEIISLQVQGMKESSARVCVQDNLSITLGFRDGSFGTIHYLANGSKKFPKERIELFTEGRILQLDNFLKLRGFGWPGFSKKRLLRQDKGQTNCVRALLEAIEQGGPSPIPAEELFEVAKFSIQASDMIREHSV